MGSPAPVYTLGFRAPPGSRRQPHSSSLCGTWLLTEGHHERQRVFRGSDCAGGGGRSRSSARAPDRRHLLAARRPSRASWHARAGWARWPWSRVVVSLVTFAFLSTEAGQTAWLDQQVRQTRGVRRHRSTRTQYSQLEKIAPMVGYIGGGITLRDGADHDDGPVGHPAGASSTRCSAARRASSRWPPSWPTPAPSRCCSSCSSSR